MVAETDESSFSSSVVNFWDDLDPGFVECRFPVENVSYRLGCHN